MKKWMNKNKIIAILFILIIISGIIMLCVFGFEKSLRYTAGTRIEVYIPKGYEKQDIINIAKESFNEKSFSFEEVEKLNQVAAIKIKDYTQEDLENYKTKISEKYGIDKDSLEIYEITVPETRIRTIIVPYILPVLLVFVLSLIYIIFRNIKSEDKIKLILEIIYKLAIIIGLYFSLIVVVRLPFGDYTMPIALAIYLISLLILTNDKK